MHRSIPVVFLASSALLIGGCASQVPHGEVSEAGNPVTVMVSEGSSKEIVLGETYRQALAKEGINAELAVVGDADSAQRVEWLVTGQADLIAGCTGELLAALNPAAALKLAAGSARPGGEEGGAGSEDANVAVYEQMMSAFPGALDVADWSPAQACDEDAVLPNNVVPVYQKEAVGRGGKNGLNKVNRYLTTQTLDELADAYEETLLSDGPSAARERLTQRVAEEFQVVR